MNKEYPVWFFPDESTRHDALSASLRANQSATQSENTARCVNCPGDLRSTGIGIISAILPACRWVKVNVFATVPLASNDNSGFFTFGMVAHPFKSLYCTPVVKYFTSGGHAVGGVVCAFLVAKNGERNARAYQKRWCPGVCSPVFGGSWGLSAPSPLVWWRAEPQAKPHPPVTTPGPGRAGSRRRRGTQARRGKAEAGA